MSYNLRKHAATSELRDLVGRNPVDILCIQEGDASRMPAEIGELTLAGATYKNSLGLAIYYRPDVFEARESHAFTLRKSIHDRVLQPAIERLLTTRFVELASGKEIQLASFHASPLSASNLMRRRQIGQSLAHLTGLSDGSPILMTGDFNYPLLRGPLIRQVEKLGYSLNLSDGPTYFYTKSIAYHFDFLLSKGFDVQLVETLGKGLSDHRPIVMTAEILDRTGASPADTGQTPHTVLDGVE
jgi:endonuclease/exonuclease/phosphatase (EEP) superfamily protein YafD